MKTALLLFGGGLCFAQGWTDLTSTHTQNACPANGATFPNYAVTGQTFADSCFRVITSWDSGAIDTKRNRLLFMGDGHDGVNDNAVYSLDMVTRSVSIGTSCVTTNCTTNTSVPTVTRLNDPSMTGSGSSITCPQSVPPDGAPIARQTYGTLIYLPKSDRLFNYGTSDVCGDAFGVAGYGYVYLLTFAANGSPTGWTKSANLGPNDSGAGSECALDPTYTGSGDAVVCLVTNHALYRYVPDTDTWSTLSTGDWTVQNGGTVVVDPMRHLLFVIGPNFDAVNPRIWSIDLLSPTTAAINWTSSVTGCADLMAGPYPSLVYDPSLNRIVGYQPMTAASPGVAANVITIFDPAMKTCVNQPQLGGAGPSAHSSILAGQGMFGRFNYIPSIGKYVLINNVSGDAYSFTLNLTATHGIGTYGITCMDRDGDGYGVGAGCTGPDADDQDSAVHTSAQFISKWTDIPTGLKHLGYNPANLWYVATGGVDTGTPAACKNTVGSPCATIAYIYAHGYAAGDMVLWRSGTYHEFVQPPDGSAGSPTMTMSYPGELATFTSSGGAADGFGLLSSQTYAVLDGFKISGSGSSNDCIGGGENTNIVMRHIETTGCAIWGIDFQGDTTGVSGCPSVPCRPLSDITVSDSVLHDSAQQHGLYFSSHESAISTDIFWYRIISYNNPWNGFHTTGQFSNLVMSQDLTYSNGLSGYSWQNGTSNSFLFESISINDNQGMDITLYPGTGDPTCSNGAPYPVGTVCPFAQSNNLIANFTVFLTGTDSTGTSNAHTYAVIVGRQGTCTNTSCIAVTMTGNKFQNVIAMTNNTDGGSYASGSTYPPFLFPDNTGVKFLPSTTFQNVLSFDSANSGIVAGYGPGASFGYAPYNCTTLSTVASASTGCQNVTPQFTSTCAYNTLSTCNLKPLSTSPAVGAGTPPQYPRFDLLGNAISETGPTLGGFAVIGVSGGSGSGISGKVTVGGNVVIR